MLTGCFIQVPLSGFDSHVFMNKFQDVCELVGTRGAILTEDV